MTTLPFPTDEADWPALARAAELFLKFRLRDDPAAIKERRLSQGQAAAREAVARAVAAIFTAIERGEDIPDFPISTRAIAADLATTARMVASYAADREGESAKAYAASLAIIAEHCRADPDSGALPIRIVHSANQILRARRKADGAGDQS